MLLDAAVKGPGRTSGWTPECWKGFGSIKTELMRAALSLSGNYKKGVKHKYCCSETRNRAPTSASELSIDKRVNIQTDFERPVGELHKRSYVERTWTVVLPRHSF